MCRAEAILSAKWNIPILRALSKKPARFGELRQLMPGVASNILVARLREFEAKGLVERAVIHGPVPKHAYQLTELGRSVRPVIAAIDAWALNFDGASDQTRPSDCASRHATSVALSF